MPDALSSPLFELSRGSPLSLSEGVGGLPGQVGQDVLDIQRRFQVLLSISRIARLEAAGPQRTRTNHYDARHVALAMVHSVVHNVGIGRPTDRQYILETVSPLLELMDASAGRGPNSSVHEEMVDYMLANLTNDHGDNKPFIEEYLKFEDGRLVRAEHEIVVLQEVFQRRSGKPEFELSTEFTNIYLTLLGQPIADRVVAQEAVLKAQIESGRLEEAHGSAREARMITEQYQKDLLRRIEETRRNIHQVDWLEETPKLLSDARTHISTRLDFETTLQEVVQELSATGDRDSHRLISEIAREVAAVIETHMNLLPTLKRARDTFFEEHERQRFQPPALDPKPHPGQDLLRPALASIGSELVAATSVAGAILRGFRIQVVPTMANDLRNMLRPKQEREEHTLFVTSEEKVVVEPSKQTLPLEKFEELVAYLDVPAETPLEVILRNAQADGHDDDSLWFLAAIAAGTFAEPTDYDPYLVSGGEPAFAIGSLDLPDGGITITPRSELEND